MSFTDTKLRAGLEEAAYQAKMTAALIGCRSTLTDAAQILDETKQERLQNGSWSEWNQGVRDNLTLCLAALHRLLGD